MTGGRGEGGVGGDWGLLEKVGAGDRDKKWGTRAAGGESGGGLQEERDKRVLCVYSHGVAARKLLTARVIHFCHLRRSRVKD